VDTDRSELEAYQVFSAVDDIAFSALKVSLSEPERSVMLDRLREDWMTDVGAIGMLRRQHIQTQSIDEPARAYWISRREPLSPRIESLLASFLINLASSVVYDILKELTAEGYDVAKLLQARGVDLSVAIGFVQQIDVLVAHVRTFLALYRAKQDIARLDEIRKVVQDVLHGQKITFDSKEADVAIELLMKNLVPAVRGVVSEELKRQRVFVDSKANGFLTRGIGASPGLGIGSPVRWSPGRASFEVGHVLFIVDEGMKMQSVLLALLEEAAAVVTWNCSMTSHIPVVCRGIGRPAVIISEEEVPVLMRRKFLVVDGAAGHIRSFHTRPKSLLTPY
jgi:phosphohistidine swiveling domain-containing protein